MLHRLGGSAFFHQQDSQIEVRRDQLFFSRQHILIEPNGVRAAVRQAVGVGQIELGAEILRVLREVAFERLGRLGVLLLFKGRLGLLEQLLRCLSAERNSAKRGYRQDGSQDSSEDERGVVSFEDHRAIRKPPKIAAPEAMPWRKTAARTEALQARPARERGAASTASSPHWRCLSRTRRRACPV